MTTLSLNLSREIPGLWSHEVLELDYSRPMVFFSARNSEFGHREKLRRALDHVFTHGYDWQTKDRKLVWQPRHMKPRMEAAGRSSAIFIPEIPARHSFKYTMDKWFERCFDMDPELPERRLTGSQFVQTRLAVVPVVDSYAAGAFNEACARDREYAPLAVRDLLKARGLPVIYADSNGMEQEMIRVLTALRDNDIEALLT